MTQPRNGVRFQSETRKNLQNVAKELDVSFNWLVNELCKEGLATLDYSRYKRKRDADKQQVVSALENPPWSSKLRKGTS